MNLYFNIPLTKGVARFGQQNSRNYSNLNGDTTGLSKALETVNKTIKDTQSHLKDVERLLKLDPSHTELLSQKQEKLKTTHGCQSKKKLRATNVS